LASSQQASVYRRLRILAGIFPITSVAIHGRRGEISKAPRAFADPQAYLSWIAASSLQRNLGLL